MLRFERAESTIAPFSSTKIAFTHDVPTSIPSHIHVPFLLCDFAIIEIQLQKTGDAKGGKLYPCGYGIRRAEACKVAAGGKECNQANAADQLSGFELLDRNLDAVLLVRLVTYMGSVSACAGVLSADRV